MYSSGHRALYEVAPCGFVLFFRLFARLVKVVAKPIWRDDKEDVVLFSVAFIDTWIADCKSGRLKFGLRPFKVRHENGCTFIAGIDPVDREPDPHTVSFHNYGGLRRIASFDFGQSKLLTVPRRGFIDAVDGQRKNVVSIGMGRFEQRFVVGHLASHSFKWLNCIRSEE